MRKVTARANINIALCKYWGKMNEIDVLPYTTSISFTCDSLYTLTTIEKDETLEEDEFILDGKLQSKDQTAKISDFLNRFHRTQKVRVISENHVPTAAGLASSASGYAALATAANAFFRTSHTPHQLASLTRFGSGSASRSILGGFCKWEKGTANISVVSSDADIMAMIVIVVNQEVKKISSKEAMKKTIETSPFFNAFIKTCELDAVFMERAIRQKELTTIGRIAQQNAMNMHATMMTSIPPILYFESGTMDVLHFVEEIRNKHVECYPTMDAGPNVKLIVHKKDVPLVEELIRNRFPKYSIIATYLGKGSEVIDYQE